MVPTESKLSCRIYQTPERTRTRWALWLLFFAALFSGIGAWLLTAPPPTAYARPLFATCSDARQAARRKRAAASAKHCCTSTTTGVTIAVPTTPFIGYSFPRVTSDN